MMLPSPKVGCLDCQLVSGPHPEDQSCGLQFAKKPATTEVHSLCKPFGCPWF